MERIKSIFSWIIPIAVGLLLALLIQAFLLVPVNQFIPKFVGNFDSFHFFKTFPQAKLSTNTRSFHNLTAYPQNPHKKQGYLLTSCGYVVN
ncbi:hypothetical protein ATX59_09685 [Oenococcus oeni]|uniref:Uncharacterized protein n=1 Tax=Oenococcus oeni TaxID=1247 RepID=A0A6N4A461_OENOE|nr:hypothetical protein [Oenococcus oeni]OIM20178.1 hypothetical protein ATX59_09685 [Oenococcus oeni]